MLRLEHTLEKKPGFTGAQDENGHLSEMSTKKTTALLLDANRCKTYCSYNKKVTMCQGRYNKHYAFMCSTMQDPPK